MKSIKVILLFVFLLSSCAPATTAIPVSTSTQTATLTPTPKTYTLRIEFSTSADWSSLSISNDSSISDVRIVEKQGELTDAVANKTYIGINQTLENAQKLNSVSITVDLDVSNNPATVSIPFLLQKGAINNSTVRFYNVLNDESYLLLQEISRDGYVEGQTDTNPYNFSFDLKSLFKDAAALPTPTLIPAPTQIGGGSGKLIFDYALQEYKNNFPDMKGDSNVFTVNVDGTSLTPVTNMEGYNFLKDVSPDGTKALIVSAHDWNSTTADLYLVNLNELNSEPAQLAKGLPYASWDFNLSARWLDNTKIIFIGRGDKGFGIYSINADGTNQILISRSNAYEILALTPNRVFWNTVISGGNYHTNPVWWSNIDGSETDELTYKGKQIGAGNAMLSFRSNNIAFSPDGTKVAWIDAGTPDSGHKENWLQIANLTDIDHPLLSVELIFSGPDIKWRRNGKSLIVFDEAAVNFGVGKGSNNYGYFEVSAETGEVIKNFNLSDEMMGAGDDFTPLQCGDISPDDKLLPCLIFASNKEKTADGLLPAQLNFLNLETGIMSEVNGFNFFFMGFDARTIFWIP